MTMEAKGNTVLSLEQALEALDADRVAMAIAGEDTSQIDHRIKIVKTALTKAIGASKKQSDIDAEQEAARLKTEAKVERFVLSIDLHFDTTNAKYWWNEHGSWNFSPAAGLKAKLSGLPHTSHSMMLVSEYLQKNGRNVAGTTYDVARPPRGLLNLLTTNLIEPVAGGEPDKLFRKLMLSIATSEEGADHIEKWIVARYTLAAMGKASYQLPTLVIGDPEGGSGKGILCEHVLPVIFGASAVLGNFSIDDVTGRFNSAMEGKLVVAINEVDHEQTNISKLKSVLGSRDVRLEAKGLATRYVPNIGAYIMAGNKAHEVVRLKGDSLGVDRRFSIVLSNGPRVKEWVAAEFDCAPSEAGEIIGGKLIPEVFTNRAKVAVWLAHLIEKHGGIEYLAPYHGAEYQAVVAHQKKIHEKVFEAVFHDRFEHIAAITLRDIYLEICNREGVKDQYRLTRNSLYRTAEDWLKKNRANIGWGKATSPRSNCAMTWFYDKEVGSELGRARWSEAPWFDEDQRGERVISIDID